MLYRVDVLILGSTILKSKENLWFFIFIIHYKIQCMLHNMPHNLLAGIEEHDWVVLHQPGKRFLNQCSPNPLTHSNGLLQRHAYLFPSYTTDMNNGQSFFPCPRYWTCGCARWPFPGWTSTRPWQRSRGEPRTTSRRRSRGQTLPSRSLKGDPASSSSG